MQYIVRDVFKTRDKKEKDKKVIEIIKKYIKGK